MNFLCHKEFLTDEYGKSKAESINLKGKRPLKNGVPFNSSNTVYLCAVDKEGILKTKKHFEALLKWKSGIPKPVYLSCTVCSFSVKNFLGKTKPHFGDTLFSLLLKNRFFREKSAKSLTTF